MYLKIIMATFSINSIAEGKRYRSIKTRKRPYLYRMYRSFLPLSLLFSSLNPPSTFTSHHSIPERENNLSRISFLSLKGSLARRAIRHESRTLQDDLAESLARDRV